MEKHTQSQDWEVRFVPTLFSPLLANIALHGMENSIKEFAENIDYKDNYGKQLAKKSKRQSLSFIRYADDFVILHKNHSVIKECQRIISEWLKDMGLELKLSKTRLTHTLHNVGNEKPGFNFLGFNIRQYKVGKYASRKGSRGKLLGFKTLIKPSRKSIQNHYNQIAEIIKTSISLSQDRLIGRLNPIIRGWCNYYSSAISKEAFSKLDYLVIWKLWKWGIRRHRKKGKTWLKDTYFQNEFSFDEKNNRFTIRKWVFATTKDGNIDNRLISHAETPITRHIKVKNESSPYDGDLIYWSSRMGKNPLLPVRKAKLLKTQKGKCNLCNLMFRYDDVLEEDHIIPTSKGGTDYYKNLQLLHRHCHDVKTNIDGSNDTPFKPIKLPSG